ncbi:MAG: GTP cyclohydrolase I FolE2, partial [Thermoplasmata archaeon]
KKYKDLPDDTIVIARSESEESIHKHNAFAERITTLGELREGSF